MNVLGMKLGYIVKFMPYIRSEPIFSHFAAGDMVTIAPTCSANTVELKIVYSESDDYNIRVRIDYVCNWNENEMVSGNKLALHSHTHCSYLQVCMSICGNLRVVEVK